MNNIINKAIIIGSGGHCRSVVSTMLENKIIPQIIFDISNQNSQNEFIMNVPVFSSNTLEEHINMNSLFFIAIGDNKLRREWYNKIKKLNLQMPNLISKYSFIDKSAKLGDGNYVAPFSYIGPEVVLGENNIINTKVIVEHEVILGNSCHLAPGSIIAGRCAVGSNTFIGIGSKVKDGIKIAKDTTLGAGSVLINNIETINETHVGVPAKKIK